MSDADPAGGGRKRIAVGRTLSIPAREITYRASRSGGPGGQHADTTSTRVELTWNVRTSQAVTAAQRARIMERLGNRIDSAGVLRLAAGGSRSQARNRQEVTRRFRALLREAIRPPRPRRKTRPPRRANEKRLREKRRRAELKKRRGRVREE